MKDETPRWLHWARRIQAIAQTGMHHTQGYYDHKNYEELADIAAEMLENGAGLPKDDALRLFLAQPGYATVKVDVRAAVVREGRVLLVQERMDRKWCMPGGWADVGESPATAVAREVREESGLLVRPTKVLGVWDANRAGRPMEFFHAFKVVMLCDLLGGELSGSDETLMADFFDFDALPELSPNRTNAAHLTEVRAHLNDPCRPTAFD